jgi:hypothetical protein
MKDGMKVQGDRHMGKGRQMNRQDRQSRKKGNARVKDNAWECNPDESFCDKTSVTNISPGMTSKLHRG